jgi:hypothetical protein
VVADVPAWVPAHGTVAVDAKRRQIARGWAVVDEDWHGDVQDQENTARGAEETEKCERDAVYRDLPANTVLVSRKDKLRVRLRDDMHGALASVERIRKDGHRDERHVGGWSGTLSCAEWGVETLGEDPGMRKARVLSWLQAQTPGEWLRADAVDKGANVQPALMWNAVRALQNEGLVETMWHPLHVRAKVS